jgi:hypothetical protein
MRRLAVVLAIIATPLATALPAAAGPLIETNQVDWDIPSGQCPNLAPGTTLTGSGNEMSITTLRTNASGVRTIMNTTHTHGTSFDQNENVYVFDYSNEFRGTETAPGSGLFTGLMTDHFSNSGSGPAKLNNGFVASITFNDDFSVFFFNGDPISSHGDPLDFAAGGTAACDPL